MQTIQTWLLPRHYSMYSRRTRRLDWAALLALLIIVGGSFSGVKMASAWRLEHAVPDNSTQAASLTDFVKRLQQIDAQQSNPPAAMNFNGLQPKVQAWVNAHGNAQWGVVVQDLSNPDNKMSINAQTPFTAASLYKLFLTIPLNSKVPFANWQNSHISTEQGDHTYAQCVQAMLANSDNPCGEAIGGYLGWNKATQAVAAAGFSRTMLNNTTLTTTADDVAGYFSGLARGNWFDEKTRNFILESLAEQTHRSGIPHGCMGCEVLNKTGELDHVTNDAAIIYKGNTHYVLSILSKDGTFDQVADLTKLINTSLP